jgi:hypothetical protein
MRISLTAFVLSALILSACEKGVVLDLEQVAPKIVIEGLVTNHPDFQYVKISRSNDFYTTGPTPRVNNAVVTVTDDLGNSTQFVHNPNSHKDSSGYYLPPSSFLGVVGRTYSLRIDLEGIVYQAQDRLNPVLSVDSLTSELDPEEVEDPDDPDHPDRVYSVKFYAKEPQNTVDYYLFTFFRNDTLVLEREIDIYFSDDALLAENINGVEFPGHYALDDTVVVNTFSMSRQGFVFYSDLATLLNSDGGMFSPPPANCRNNLSNGALGFFQVSAVVVAKIIVKE